MTRPDLLRPARVAVRAGDFRAAASALDALPPAAREDAEWLLLAAMTQWRLGQFPASRANALAARDRFRTRMDGDGEMRAENVAAAGALATGGLTDAEVGFSRAHRLAEARGDALLAARCANNRGNVAFYLGDHDGALGYYRLAAAGFERLGFAHGLAEAWINQSLVARDAGRMAEALAHAERALAAAEAAGSARVIAQAHANIGEARAALGDPRLGRVHLHRALHLARREADQLAQAEALRLLANLEAADGRAADAERLLAEAEAIVDRLQHPWARGEVLRDRAALVGRLGRADDAARLRKAAAAAFADAGSTVRAAALRSGETAAGRSAPDRTRQ